MDTINNLWAILVLMWGNIQQKAGIIPKVTEVGKNEIPL